MRHQVLRFLRPFPASAGGSAPRGGEGRMVVSRGAAHAIRNIVPEAVVESTEEGVLADGDASGVEVSA